VANFQNIGAAGDVMIRDSMGGWDSGPARQQGLIQLFPVGRTTSQEQKESCRSDPN
jgi:hypothetical protein